MISDGRKPSAGNRKTANLTHAAEVFRTPRARDHKDGATTLVNAPSQRRAWPPTTGDECGREQYLRDAPDLGPLFVKALVGGPPGGPPLALWQRCDFSDGHATRQILPCPQDGFGRVVRH